MNNDIHPTPSQRVDNTIEAFKKKFVVECNPQHYIDDSDGVDEIYEWLEKALTQVQEEAKRDIVKKLTWKPKGEWEENLRDLINT